MGFNSVSVEGMVKLLKEYSVTGSRYQMFYESSLIKLLGLAGFEVCGKHSNKIVDRNTFDLDFVREVSSELLPSDEFMSWARSHGFSLPVYDKLTIEISDASFSSTGKVKILHVRGSSQEGLSTLRTFYELSKGVGGLKDER